MQTCAVLTFAKHSYWTPNCFYANATLTGARFDGRTRWPVGFNPTWLGAILTP